MTSVATASETTRASSGCGLWAMMAVKTAKVGNEAKATDAEKAQRPRQHLNQTATGIVVGVGAWRPIARRRPELDIAVTHHAFRRPAGNRSRRRALLTISGRSSARRSPARGDGKRAFP